jgi:hypothetical protein
MRKGTGMTISGQKRGARRKGLRNMASEKLVKPDILKLL